MINKHAKEIIDKIPTLGWIEIKKGHSSDFSFKFYSEGADRYYFLNVLGYKSDDGSPLIEILEGHPFIKEQKEIPGDSKYFGCIRSIESLKMLMDKDYLSIVGVFDEGFQDNDFILININCLPHFREWITTLPKETR